MPAIHKPLEKGLEVREEREARISHRSSRSGISQEEEVEENEAENHITQKKSDYQENCFIEAE